MYHPEIAPQGRIFDHENPAMYQVMEEGGWQKTPVRVETPAPVAAAAPVSAEMFALQKQLTEQRMQSEWEAGKAKQREASLQSKLDLADSRQSHAEARQEEAEAKLAEAQLKIADLMAIIAGNAAAEIPAAEIPAPKAKRGKTASE